MIVSLSLSIFEYWLPTNAKNIIFWKIYLINTNFRGYFIQM